MNEKTEWAVRIQMENLEKRIMGAGWAGCFVYYLILQAFQRINGISIFNKMI